MTFPLISGDRWYARLKDGRVLRVVAFSLNEEGTALEAYCETGKLERFIDLVHEGDLSGILGDDD